jgi:regulator of cell morphogenesis and NO signaling
VSYPIDLIIEYLKHSHYLFVKQKLPYIGRLGCRGFKANHPKRIMQLKRDLKILFPLFLEDFTHHIYEEEDTLCSSIFRMLERAARMANFNPCTAV